MEVNPCLWNGPKELYNLGKAEHNSVHIWRDILYYNILYQSHLDRAGRPYDKCDDGTTFKTIFEGLDYTTEVRINGMLS